MTASSKSFYETLKETYEEEWVGHSDMVGAVEVGRTVKRLKSNEVALGNALGYQLCRQYLALLNVNGES